MGSFAEGYAYFVNNISAYSAAELSGAYVSKVEAEIKNFSDLLNKEFGGKKTHIDKLKGNIAEHWHAETFNINAVVKGSSNLATVPDSHGFASVDVHAAGIDAGLKYYKTAKDTLDQQAKTARESYHHYVSKKGTETFEEYLKNRNIMDPDAPIYEGQVRIVPKEQLEEIKVLLKLKIAGEEATRPEQVQRYKETLRMINDHINDGKGVESIPLNNADAEELARLAKENGVSEEKLREMGLSTEDLIGFSDVMNEAFRAGLTAATISMVLKIAPEIYKALSFLIQNRELDGEQFKQIGFAALSGASEGFIKGTIAAALTTACKAGLFEQPLKTIDPSIIGAITSLAINTMKNAFFVVKGTMTRSALVNELVEEMFVTTGSLVLGSASQALIKIPVLGFMLGSFVGSVVGSFAYNAGYKALLSFCIDTGFTMFGLVEQNYELPDDVLQSIGVEVFEYEQFKFEEFKHKEFKFDEFSFDKFNPEGLSISVLRRGVIGVSQIGYIN